MGPLRGEEAPIERVESLRGEEGLRIGGEGFFIREEETPKGEEGFLRGEKGPLEGERGPRRAEESSLSLFGPFKLKGVGAGIPLTLLLFVLLPVGYRKGVLSSDNF